MNSSNPHSTKMLGHSEYSCSAETYSSTITASSSSSSPSASLRKKKSKNKRRFSEEQLKSLESMFDTESRVEPRKKEELARELGLQPRQVAIWFQNRRARCKSKQLQRDYSILRANYNTLASKFDALKKENHSLLTQLQKLNEVVQNPEDQTRCRKKVEVANCLDRESDNGETIRCEAEVMLSPSMERSEHVLGVLSDDDSSIKAEYFGLEDELTLINFVDQCTDGSLTSPEDWGNLESDDLLAQTDSGYQWWDFWS